MMDRILSVVLLVMLARTAMAEAVVATRTIRAQEIISAGDVALSADIVKGAMSDPLDVIGFEARRVLYTGRPIRHGDIGPPAIVERNAVVELVFHKGGLTIVTEGRSLGRAGVGDTINVLNLASRNTVNGTVAEDGSIHVASQ